MNLKMVRAQACCAILRMAHPWQFMMGEGTGGTAGGVRRSAHSCTHAAADGAPSVERPRPACEQPENARGGC
jgi:hypothetical protein